MTGEIGASPPGGIVIISYPLIGDFVRTHTLVRILRARHPDTPIDIVARRPSVEIAALMPEVRNGIAETFQRNRLDLGARLDLARRLRRNRYRTAIVSSRAWKAALLPFLAAIPERIGWFGEARYPLINRPRFGERRHRRFVEYVASLGLNTGEELPQAWPAPQLVIPETTMQQWRATAPEANDARPILMLAPGARGPERMWPVEKFAGLARRAVDKGWTVWVSGAASEASLAETIKSDLTSVRTFMGAPLITTACQMVACSAFVGNNSGLLHFAAALGTPCVGVFAPTYPYDVAPINEGVRFVNPVAAARHGTPAIWAGVEAVEQELAVLCKNDWRGSK